MFVSAVADNWLDRWFMLIWRLCIIAEMCLISSLYCLSIYFSKLLFCGMPLDPALKRNCWILTFTCQKVSPQGLTYHLKHWFINSIHKVCFSSIKLFFAVSIKITSITYRLVGFLLCTTCSCALWYIKCTINTLCCMILYRFIVSVSA